MDESLDNKNSLREWQEFIQGKTEIHSEGVSPDILEDWMQCRNLQVDPLGEPAYPLITGTVLSKRLDDAQDLLTAGRSLLNRLGDAQMRCAAESLMLFDAEGYLLHVVHRGESQPESLRSRWVIGTQWTLSRSGNTVISCVLKNNRPAELGGPQHFLQPLHGLTASGAPVFDPDGKLLGGLALAAFNEKAHPDTLNLAVALAWAIENELKAQKALTQYQHACATADAATALQKTTLSAIPEALMAITHDGRITDINPQTQKMFALQAQDVRGQKIEDLFAGEENRPLHALIQQTQSIHDAEIRLRSAAGWGDYTLTLQSIGSAGGSVRGKLLIFSEIQRIKSLVSRYIGNKARLKFSDIHGHNSVFRKNIDQARVISKSASNVLLLGESGTGKDILAQAIHNESPRRDAPYVAINCGAIPRDLIASELFGHDEGAFTGSRRGGHAGKFELAEGGTIFLDEIAETPLDIQAVLLRVLEDKSIVRIGANRIQTVDVRIVSATNKDLLDEVNRGNFRKDLYYRLNVFNIHLPPLRERRDDIAPLVAVFVNKYEAALGKTITHVDPKILDIFMQYAWPGNVRELQNVVERMVNYASSGELTAGMIPPEIIDTRPTRKRKVILESPEDTEKRLIKHLLTLKYRRKHIAEQLNMSRATLYRKIEKYKLTSLLIRP